MKRRVWRRSGESPREEGGLSGGRLLERVGQRRQLGRDVAELGVTALDAEQDDVEHLHHAGQAGVGGQRRQDRLYLDERVGHLLDVVGGQQQQAVALEEPAAVRLAHVVEEFGPLAQRLGQPCGAVVGQFRRRAVDHDEG